MLQKLGIIFRDVVVNLGQSILGVFLGKLVRFVDGFIVVELDDIVVMVIVIGEIKFLRFLFLILVVDNRQKVIIVGGIFIYFFRREVGFFDKEMIISE